MSTAQIKAALLKQIDEADERLLKMIYALVEAYSDTDEVSVIGYDAHGNPTAAPELKASLKQELEDAKAGKYISLDQLKIRSEKWLNGTK
jgi:hypothetical protein